MKYVVLILDGAADRPLEELGGRTTLAAAATPELDRMAREGRVGMARTVPEGMEPSSAAACMSILGFDPARYPMGRGAIEAASLGIELGPSDVAFRCNLVTVEDGTMRDHSAGHIGNGDSHPIVQRLGSELGDEGTRFFEGLSYRHILRLSGPEAARTLEAVCTPPHDIIGRPVAGHLPAGPGSERLLDLMERSKSILAADPVNARRAARGESRATQIWLFWGGARPEGLPSFTETHGLRAAITSAVDLLGGLADLLGIDRLDVAGVTDGQDNDYAAQAEGAIASLVDHDLVVVHVEAPDEAGHAGDAAAKIAAIEAIDREMVSRLRAEQERRGASGDGLRILAMPDHPTPIELRTHSSEPVPFVMHGPRIAGDAAERYDEDAASGTGLDVDGWGLLARLIG